MAVPAFDPQGMADEAFGQKDANRDGTLSADELKDWPGVRAAFGAMDKNKDGKVDQAEFEEHIAGYAVGKIGMQSLTCFVTANGKPVSGLTVDFTPEPMFAAYAKAGRAMTGSDGSGAVLPTGGGLPGMAPGMYRVSISKREGEREMLPAKYNVKSELGFEVSNAGGGAPARFDIAPR
ncbi:MAG: hypothetical protein AB7U97_24715 [Pirellulales bacterium]